MTRMTGRLMLVAAVSSLIMAGTAMPTNRPSPQLGEPLPDLTPSELVRFAQGKAVFSREFTAETGLGPFFNNASCALCHEDPVVGGAGAFGEDDVDTERHATAGEQPTCDELEATGGPVFRQQTTGPALPAIPALAEVRVGIRSTPALFGFGLIEAIPDSDILANQGRAGGRAAKLPNGTLGRFGRKATDSDLLTFIRGAFDKEQGVVVPSELSPADLARTVDFVRFLAPPPPVLGVDRYGEEMFQAAGCATCHVPTFKTRSSIEALDRKIVYIYSDLLLHDMGAALADLCKGVATRAEFRTEPLIGLRNRTRFLHDGRALSIESAIVQHGGQGAAAATAFLNLSQTDRLALLQYLRRL